MPPRHPPLVLASTPSTCFSDPPIGAEHFEALWRRFRPFVLKRAKFRLGRGARFAEDVAQDVALVLLSALRAGKLPAASPCVYAFLARTVDYCASARPLRRATRPQLLGSRSFAATDDAVVEGDPATAQRGASHHDDPLVSAEARRETELGGFRLRDCAAALPERYRAVAELTLDGLAPAEIAARLRLKPATVRVQLLRAKKLLFEAMQAPSAKKAAGLARFVPVERRRPPSRAIDKSSKICFNIGTLTNWTTAQRCLVGSYGTSSVTVLQGPAIGFSGRRKFFVRMNTQSVDRFGYLGDPSKGDPVPVFRDEAADATSWPDGAAFKIEFTAESCPNAPPAVRRILPVAEFYSTDGWPLGFPERRKAVLSDLIKEDFHALPPRWRTWSEWTWLSAQQFPELRRRSRGLVTLLRPVAELTATLSEIAT